MVDRLANSEINNQRIAHVEACFGNSGQSLQEVGRVLVGEGVLTKLCRKKPKLRQFFLFNDILVYGNIVISKKKYNKQTIIPLKLIKVEEIPDNDVIIPVSDDNENGSLRNGWLIISPTKSFAVYAQTSMEKQEWMSHMRRGIEEQKVKAGITDDTTDVAPQWVPDNDANQCMRCKKTKFSAINRRHHCRKCGFVVCNACSSHRAIIPYQSTKPIRVCGVCFQEISQNPNAVERPSLKKGSLFARPSQRPIVDGGSSSSNGATRENDIVDSQTPPGMNKYLDSSDSDSDEEPGGKNTSM
uniref:pleckstrin homology domain-containing family F member 2-like n=1 Tax=Styela clava TaxID=7725 RepID=UPI00193A3C9D|nr:pleckstrin homology domain-containing family F member 2-like [Styela clava]